MKLSLAAEFIKGTKAAVANPSDKFTYFLASLQVGFIPAGPIGLYTVRLLVAYDMQPALDPPGENGQSMVLYQWHKDHDAAINMPPSRNLADWTPVNHSFAAGVGAGFSLNSAGTAFHIGAFILVTHSEEDTLILIVGELYLLKNPDPIAFVAIEYDFAKAKFGLMAGVDMGLDKFVGGSSIPPSLAKIAKLTGTIYFGNKPWSLAIGQLADQRSWLGFTVKVDWIDLRIQIALGLQMTDGGPKGVGLVLSVSGGNDWGIGAFIVFGSIGFIAGTWKTGSDSAGIHAWAQLGFKIQLCYVFSLGADIDLDLTYLVKHPWYVTLTGHVHIDTPWFLPDVTFQFSKTWNESLPFDTSSTTQALSSGSASSPNAPGQDSVVPLHVPALSDGNTDALHLYTFNELNAVSGVAVTAVVVPADLAPVAVDADVSIDYVNPLANDAAIATESYPGGADPGTQKVQDLTIRYALKSISIQRRPRFGPGAGTWTNLVAATDTELDLPAGGSVHATPAVSFRWDADTRADGVLAPKRLLVNCRTPYSLVVGSQQNDEEALANDDGFPCCSRDLLTDFKPTWHVLNWAARQPGVRCPASEQFSDDGALWRWNAPPITINGIGTFAGQVVTLDLPTTSTLLGSVDLPSPASTFMVQVDPVSAGIVCTVDAYSGLALIASRTVAGGGTSAPVQLNGTLNAPITRLTLRVAVAPAAPGERRLMLASPVGIVHDPGVAAVQIVDLRYQERRDVLTQAGRRQRCLASTDTTASVGGGGKMAFLPNHDYAVTTTVEVTLSHATGGSKTLSLSEPAFFRTKGMLGLNATPNVGDELRPYVASTYPANRTVLLYRQEPVAIAFTEDLSNLLPVDRVPAAGDPPEKAQLMQLCLSVERLASIDGAQRLTATSDDWITAHDGLPPAAVQAPFRNDSFAVAKVRKAASQDIRVKRFEAVLDAAGCSRDPLHSSQVLMHFPVGPDGSPGPWEGQAAMRATVRAKDGPFTERRAFGPADAGAFSYLSDAGGSPPWSLADGSLVASAGGRRYASFGEPTWNHVKVSTVVDPAGGIAGLAVGLSGSSPVQQAMLALLDHGSLVLVRRTAGADEEVSPRKPLPAVAGPVQLHVTAFDDILRASVGDVVVEADRGPVREGRIALVSDSNANFSSVLLDSLDMYAVEFATSRYLSFADHVASRDPVIYEHDSAAMGADAVTTPGHVLSTRSADIAAAMSTTADPQRRQQLFAQVLSDVGLGQLQRCDRLTFTRLTDSTGTTALLLESPEPISFLHDVTLTLLRRTSQAGHLVEPPAGTIAAIRPEMSSAGITITPSTTRSLAHDDVPLTVTVLGDGGESRAIVIPGTGLTAGTYILTFAFSRSRWQTMTTDPDASYQDAATVELTW